MILFKALYESNNYENSNVIIHIRDPKSFSDSEIKDIIELYNHLVKDNVKYNTKLQLKLNADQKTNYTVSDFMKTITRPRPGVILQRFVTAELDGHIIGLINYREYDESGTEYPGKQAFIPDVVVHPQFRKLGIGSKMFETLKYWVKKSRPIVMMFIGVMASNPGGIALYSKYGFYPVNHLMVCKL